MDGFEKNLLNRINDYRECLDRSKEKNDIYLYKSLLTECLDLLVEYRTNYKIV